MANGNGNGNGNGNSDDDLDTVANYEVVHHDPEFPEETLYLETTNEGANVVSPDELPEELKKEEGDDN